MNTTTDDSKISSAMKQGQAQFDSIREMVEALEGWQAAAEAEGWTGPHKDEFGATYFECDDKGERMTWACASWEALCDDFGIKPDTQNEEACEAIQEDALSVDVRSGWHTPGGDASAAEYSILLCTGGPACRIIGELDEYGQPETARLEVQDWFTPWTPMRPQVGPDNYDSEPILLAYARCFYFGE